MAEQIKHYGSLTELKSVEPMVSHSLADELHNKNAPKNLTFLLPNNDALKKLVTMVPPAQQHQEAQQMPPMQPASNAAMPPMQPGGQQPGQQQQMMPPGGGNGSKPELLTNSTALTALLSYHILAGRYSMSDFHDGDKIQTMLGPQAGPLTVSVRNGTVTFMGAGSACTGPAAEKRRSSSRAHSRPFQATPPL